MNPSSLRARALALPLLLGLLCGSCAIEDDAPAPSVARLLDRPAERALVDGMRQYEEGAFEAAERSLRAAISQGLRNHSDEAEAYKRLAFIACAFQRPVDCERNFRAAFDADATFRLGASEVGHPVWGPVYRRVAAERGIAVPEAPAARP